MGGLGRDVAVATTAAAHGSDRVLTTLTREHRRPVTRPTTSLSTGRPATAASGPPAPGPDDSGAADMPLLHPAATEAIALAEQQLADAAAHAQFARVWTLLRTPPAQQVRRAVGSLHAVLPVPPGKPWPTHAHAFTLNPLASL